MQERRLIRRVLPHVYDFKTVWKKEGPFRYALTSSDFPFVLLEEEEWIFADDPVVLLKELMQWDRRKMKMVKAPVAEKTNQAIRFERLSRWRIKNFPEEWAPLINDMFTPSGQVAEKVVPADGMETQENMEKSFFDHLGQKIHEIGYILLEPVAAIDPDAAHVEDYLKEWEEDERDAGLI
ncbi:MAG: hypothetical protein R6V41_02575 [Desulfobacteraceae bacterium]